MLAALPQATEAKVVRFVVEQRQVLADGVAWGTSGAYERLRGTAYMEVDPRDPLNAVIVDLDKAPRNERRMVEFSTPFFILKPVDMARGNHMIFYAAWQNRDDFNSYEKSDYARHLRDVVGPLLGSPYDDRLYALLD